MRHILCAVILNFVLVLTCASYMPDVLPVHIALDGSYADTMPYWYLYMYPVASLLIVLVIYLASDLFFRRFPRLDDSKGIRRVLVDIAAGCFALIIFISTCVALTFGRLNFLMFAEPSVFLILVVAVVIGEIRIRKAA